METINDRIEQLINDKFDGNKAAFAKSIGFPPTGLSNYLGNKRRSKPSVDMVTKIITKLNVDPYWLLTGTEKYSNSVHIGDNNTGNIATGNGNTQINAVNQGTKDDGNKSEIEELKEQNRHLQERLNDKETLLAEKERVIKLQDKFIYELSMKKQ